MAADVEIKKTPSLDTTLHGLMKYSNYSMRLLAFTHTGEGVQSIPIYCATEEDGRSTWEAVKRLSLSNHSLHWLHINVFAEIVANVSVFILPVYLC